MQLRENEILIKIIRRHASTLYGPFSLAGGILLAYFLVVYYFQFNFFGYGWQVFGTLILALAPFIIYKTYIWRKNAFLITNQRLVNNEQSGLFSRTVTEVMYEDVNEIVFKQKGLSAAVSNYGTLVIRTPSESQIIFEMIPEPEKVVELINKAKNSLRPGKHEHEQITEF
ncbi:MAG: PH domain-containing protein [Patescibacteria group bacterium]